MTASRWAGVATTDIASVVAMLPEYPARISLLRGWPDEHLLPR